MTISAALQLAQAKLSATSDAPRLDAERLLLLIIGQPASTFLYAHGDQQLTPEQEAHFSSLLERRANGEPLAYLLGEWEFYGRPFFVTPDVLIPRPETEQLVEKALQYSTDWMANNIRPMRIADIGTGSGCIAVTLACELAQLKTHDSRFKILATDISPAALAVARKNAERHGVADQIDLLEGDMLAVIAGRHVDLIVSNPPYIPTADLSAIASAKAEALAEAGRAYNTVGLTFEPKIALDGGPNGQKFIEQIKNAGVPALVESTDGEIFFF